jgi:hypothetical protein
MLSGHNEYLNGPLDICSTRNHCVHFNAHLSHTYNRYCPLYICIFQFKRHGWESNLFQCFLGLVLFTWGLSVLVGGIWWKTVLTTMDRPVVFYPIGSPNSIIFIIYWWTIGVDCDWIFDWNSYIKAMTNLPAKTMCCCITELFEQLWVLYWTLINELLIILRIDSCSFASFWYREPAEMIRNIKKLSCEKLFQEIKGIK